MTIRQAMAAIVLGASLSAAAPLLAQEPGWSSSVLPFGPEARQIRQMPIEQRPYRPGHIYGNTVRRMYYRGHPFPTGRGFSGGGGMYFGRWQ